MINSADNKIYTGIQEDKITLAYSSAVKITDERTKERCKSRTNLKRWRRPFGNRATKSLFKFSARACVAHGVSPSLNPAGKHALPHQPVVPVAVHVPVCCENETEQLAEMQFVILQIRLM